MVLLPYLSALRFSGSDAGDFLHNQLSADINALSSGESTFACYCEPKGRVLALVLVARKDSDYYMLMSTSLTGPVASRLKIYVMRSKVDIEALEGCSVFGLQAGDVSAPSTDCIASVMLPGSDDSYLIVDGDTTGEVNSSIQDAWKLAELERGITWLCGETSGQFLPQMLGYEKLGAVNFRKGCYPGQEIVARTHYLGKVKRHPRLLCTNAMICPDPLDKIEISGDGNPMEAVITDCARREEGGSCLFVVTRMNPEQNADKIEYKGLIASLL